MAEEQQSVSVAPAERAPALPANEICPGTLQLPPLNDQAISASNSGTIALDEGQASVISEPNEDMGGDSNDKPGSDDAEEESDSDAEEESDIDIDDESYNDVDSFGADSVELLKLKKEFWDNDESGRVGKLRYGERLIKSNVEKRSANRILWPTYDRNKLTTSAYEDLMDFSIEAKRADLYAMVMKWKLDGGVEKLQRAVEVFGQDAIEDVIIACIDNNESMHEKIEIARLYLKDMIKFSEKALDALTALYTSFDKEFFDQHVLTCLPDVCPETDFYLKAYNRIPSPSLFNLTFPKVVEAYTPNTLYRYHWEQSRQLCLCIQRNIHDLAKPIVQKLNKAKLLDDRGFTAKASLQAKILSFLGTIRTEMERAGVPLTTQPYASMFRTLFLDHFLAHLPCRPELS
ncbi:hypothetical protein RUND412_011221 [Rhizina undulata]